jgi:uncharacterized protein YcfJ
MRSLVLALAAIAVAAPVVPAAADTKRSSSNRHVYKGQKVCRHSKAEAGAVAGGVGGAVAGAALGGGILGTVAGGVAGVVGGKAIDRTLTAKDRCRYR